MQVGYHEKKEIIPRNAIKEMFGCEKKRMSVSCMHCNTLGERRFYKRILCNGIQYECGLPACYAEIERCAKEEREAQRAAKKAAMEKEMEDVHFIQAEKQYRDTNNRMIDPYHKIIYKRSRFGPNPWIETSEPLTSVDEANVVHYLKTHQRPIVTSFGGGM
jgi:tRNA U55 pseudouridine synthase TruB